MDLKSAIDITRLPSHVAIIMDGNGRWAKQKGFERNVGHQNGVVALSEIVEVASELGIKYLTLYAFSTENWNRPKEEVDALMSLLVETIHKETDRLIENDLRLMAIGDLKSLPDKCHQQLQDTINKTSLNKKTTLVLALSYSSKWEILNAVKAISKDINDGKLDIDNISYEIFSSYLTTASIPDPELLIRTSGEMRISNFLLLQIAYSELYFTDVLWPDFRKEQFYKAIIDFQKRERRFGKTSEQLSNNND
ncbi:MAG: isoprenyl transferase [Bacteroidales bacterium]|nr:isoprenyl transferase [Bacteroidales bacterium]